MKLSLGGEDQFELPIEDCCVLAAFSMAVVMPRLFICFTIVGLLMGPSQGHRSTFPTTSLLKQPEGARVLNLRGGGGRRRSGAQSSGYSMNKVESAVSHLGRNPSTELELVLSAVVLQVALSFAMAASQENILSLIALVNGAVYLTWQYSFSSKRKRRLRQWMMTHFLLNWDFKHQDGRRSGLPESLVLSEFSHISQTHLAANMGTLWAFGPYAVSVLGAKGFAWLYSGGALASSVATCLWPIVAPHLGVKNEPRRGTCLGASGALSAVVTYVCLHNPKQVVTIPAPGWLLEYLPGTASTLNVASPKGGYEALPTKSPSADIKVPLGLAGLLWTGMDLWGLLKLNIPVKRVETGQSKIGYPAHVGGSLFGALFYVLSGAAEGKQLLERGKQLLQNALSVPRRVFLFFVPDRWLEKELKSRERRQGYNPYQQKATPPYRPIALALLLALRKWPITSQVGQIGKLANRPLLREYKTGGGLSPP